MNKFRRNRYIQLLKKSQKIKTEGSTLYEDNYIEFRELLSYGVILDNQIIYNQRNNYISLVEKYLGNQISSFAFKYDFIEMQKKDRDLTDDIEKDFETLSTILIESKSSEFSTLIDRIFGICEGFESESEEGEFRSLVEKIFLEMKEYSEK